MVLIQHHILWISNYLQQSVITTMHFNTTKQYAVGDVISPLLIDLIGQQFAIKIILY
jgi:hypothetical protein